MYQLIKDPFDVLLLKNKDLIITILENIRKGISSGAISVKDFEKSSFQITETEEALDGFIRQVDDFMQQRKHIQDQINALESGELSMYTRDLNTALSDKDTSESKIKTIEDEIIAEGLLVPKLISEIQVKLRTFSNTEYTVTC